jgi:hypothetical protein
MTAEERKTLARKAANARWAREKIPEESTMNAVRRWSLKVRRIDFERIKYPECRGRFVPGLAGVLD